jgi:hypothetical protein
MDKERAERIATLVGECAAEYDIGTDLQPAEGGGWRIVFHGDPDDASWEVLFWEAPDFNGSPMLKVEYEGTVFYMSAIPKILFQVGYS